MSDSKRGDTTGRDRRDFLRTVGLGAVPLGLTGGVSLEALAAGGVTPLTRVQQQARIRELLQDPSLLAPGGRHVYRGPQLTGISLPVGGIGGGSIEINGQAVRHVWHIFNNFDAVSVPHSFFAVRSAAAGKKPVVRLVQTEPIGPFRPMESLSFQGEYPFGWYEFEDDAMPLKVSLEVYSPLIPMDAKNSAIPCAIFNITAVNESTEPVEVSWLAAQQNAIGYRFDQLAKDPHFSTPGGIKGREFKGYGGNRNSIRQRNDTAILHMTADMPPNSLADGDMALAGRGGEFTASASWDTLEELAEEFTTEGRLTGPNQAGPSPQGRTLDGALASTRQLAPGEARTVTFFLTWHFPHGERGQILEKPNQWGQGHRSWSHTGRQYAKWWSDALEVAHYLDEHLDEVTAGTRDYHRALYDSNLPRYLLDRISSQVACLKSQTCFWAEDGYFGGWEGCTATSGCCFGNCSHVWHYAHAHARLFPSIGRLMREQSLSVQDKQGGIPYRSPAGKVAFDGQCGEVLGAYREHLCSRDGSWLRRHWPRIRQAMEYVINTFDPGRNGIPKGPQHNTLDAELSGSTSWLGTLYLAALAASEKMARLQGEQDLADAYRELRLAGSEKQDGTLFDGKYYIQIPDQPPDRVEGENYLTGCHADQLLGQWWAFQLDLGWLYPPDHVKTALAGLFKHNFRVDFSDVTTYATGSPSHGRPRKYVYDDDHGLIMTSWPHGGRPEPGKQLRFADEVWTGCEYSAAASMLAVGMLKEALLIVRSVADRHDGRKRTGLTGYAWGYIGNPFGDDECGKFYARAMSSWSMLLTAQGFMYDGPAGIIGFEPVWQPEDHASFFSAAEGWGCFRQKRESRSQLEKIEVRWGRLRLKKMVFALRADATVARVRVTGNGSEIRTDWSVQDPRLTISLPDEVNVEAPQTLEIRVDLA